MQRVDERRPCLRAERHVLPVGHARHRRPHRGDFLAGDRVVVHAGEARLARLQIDAVSPVHFPEGVGGEELAAGGFEHVEEAVAIGLHHHLGRFALHVQRSKHRLVHPVVVERIVRRRLIEPHALARARTQCHDRVGPQVVAGTAARIPRRGIAGAPEHQIELRIVRAGYPRATPTHSRGLWLAPGLDAFLACGRDVPVPPHVPAGVDVVALDEAAMTVFGAGDAHDGHARCDQRRTGHGVAVGRRGRGRRCRLPQLLAGLGVERDDLVVEQLPDHFALEQRDAAIDDAAAHRTQCLRRIFVGHAPDRLAGHGIQRDGGVVRGRVDHAVMHDRKRFGAALVVHRVGPLRDQPAHVGLVDLIERAVALGPVAHAVDEYVAVGLVVVDQLLHGLSVGRAQRRQHEGGARARREKSLHRVVPFGRPVRGAHKFALHANPARSPATSGRDPDAVSLADQSPSA